MTSSANAGPRSIFAGAVGLFGIVAVVVGAAVFRSPIDDQCLPSASAATARPAAGTTGRPRVDPTPPPSIAAETAKPEGPGSPGVAPASVPANAREARAKLSKDMQMRRVKEAVVSLSQLLEIDPAAPTDPDVRGDIIELAMRVTLLEGPEPDTVFDAMTSRMGTTGIDILYEILTTKGGSRAAKRAEDLLKDDKIRARGSPALRIAYDLRSARGCDDKIALFDRAKTDGDGRTLGLLQLLNAACGRRNRTDCCLHDDPKLKEAIEALKASRSN